MPFEKFSRLVSIRICVIGFPVVASFVEFRVVVSLYACEHEPSANILFESVCTDHVGV